MTAPRRSPTDRTLCAIGAFFFRFRNKLFPAIFLALVVLARPSWFAGKREWDVFATGAGLCVALLGELVRCLTIGLVYIKRGGRDNRVYAENLVTAGIYAHTRNPMYIGNLAIALGFCLMYGPIRVGAGIFLSFLLVYVCIVMEEERFLRATFGAGFDAYCRDTNRFLPRLRGLTATLRQHRFDCRNVVKKEYGTLFGCAFGAYGLLAIKYRYLCGPVGILAHPVLLALLAVPLVALYGAARLLKKTGRL